MLDGLEEQPKCNGIKGELRDCVKFARQFCRETRTATNLITTNSIDIHALTATYKRLPCITVAIHSHWYLPLVVGLSGRLFVDRCHNHCSHLPSPKWCLYLPKSISVYVFKVEFELKHEYVPILNPLYIFTIRQQHRNWKTSASLHD
jgi:hypothetical protein